MGKWDVARDAACKKEIDATKELVGGEKKVPAEEVLAACLENGIPYVDLDFPPTKTSAMGHGPLGCVGWARPSIFLKKGNPQLYVNKVEANDIDQGQLGDCYLMSTIAALAEFPDQAKQYFLHPSGDEKLAERERALGAYRLCMANGGWWYTMILDDFLPVRSAGKEYRRAFAGNQQEENEMWVSLLEKGYAKLKGNYEIIEAGDALTAMSEFTGFPFIRFKCPLSKDEDCFETMLLTYQKKGMITVATPSDGDEGCEEAEYTKVGLVTDHGYTVLQVLHFPERKATDGSNDGGLKLLQIRNPWGNAEEWNGKWSDKDAAWKEDEDLAKICNFKAEKDGTFWMEWKDVLKWFPEGGVCLNQPSWCDYRLKVPVEKNKLSAIFLLTVHKKQELYVSMLQGDEEHGFSQKDAVGIFVFSSADNGKTYTQFLASGGNCFFHPERNKPVYMRSGCVGIPLLNLEPSETPYVIYMRGANDTLKQKEHIVAFQSEQNFSKEGAEVSLVEGTNFPKISKNQVTLDVSALPAVTVSYQFRPAGNKSALTESTGSALQ